MQWSIKTYSNRGGVIGGASLSSCQGAVVLMESFVEFECETPLSCRSLSRDGFGGKGILFVVISWSWTSTGSFPEKDVNVICLH